MLTAMLRLFAFLFGLLPTLTILASDHAPVSSSGVTLVIRDGQVFSSGDEVSIRGDKRPGTRCHFERVEGLSDIVSVDVCVNGSAAGALDKQGNVWLWANQWASTVRGQESDQGHVPEKHPGLSDIRSFSLADSHLIALKHNGTVVTAGSEYSANESGQLGTGDLDTPKPTNADHGVVSITGIDDAVAVEAGGEFNLILRKDGTVWGMGSAAMLGEVTGVVIDFNVEPKRWVKATQISGLSNIVAISAGHQYAIALDKSGQVWGWGYNHSGQLGPVVSEIVSIAPMKIRGLNRVTSIAAGYDFVLAATEAGDAIAIGGNTYGALGDDGGELKGDQRTISGLKNVSEVYAGHYNGFAKTKSGELWGWGSNSRTIGGFHATSGEGFLPPTKIDVHLKPAPVSKAVAGGGASTNVIFRFQDYFFERQTMTLTVDSKVVGIAELNEQKDEQIFAVEIPAGVTHYSVTGTGTDDAGNTTRIEGHGVFMVEPQTIRDDFEARVKKDGLISATKTLAKRFEKALGDDDSRGFTFAHDKPLTDAALDEIEGELARPLPESYRHAMKTIGPFRIGSPDSPHPRASLMVPDKARHLLWYAKEAERYSGDDAAEIDGSTIPENDLFRGIIDEFGYMRKELTSAETLQERPTWKRDLIVGTTEDDLYLLIGGNQNDSDRPFSTLWAPFFHEIEDDDGERELFQWGEVAGSDTNEEVEANLADAVYSALHAEYSSRGIAPIRSTLTNEAEYVLFEISNEEEPEGDKPYEGTLASDGW
jgi:alpha-tubulin suppressor-like RCC1 family protein